MHIYMQPLNFTATTLLSKRRKAYIMGESFQDCFWIQDFEADFPKKVSFKMLN